MTHTGTGLRETTRTVGPRRAGVAYFIVLFAVFILSIIIIGLWTQFFAELKQTSQQQDDTAHFYLAEAIMAKGINCIKKKPWQERFYRFIPPDKGPDAVYFSPPEDLPYHEYQSGTPADPPARAASFRMTACAGRP